MPKTAKLAIGVMTMALAALCVWEAARDAPNGRPASSSRAGAGAEGMPAHGEGAGAAKGRTQPVDAQLPDRMSSETDKGISEAVASVAGRDTRPARCARALALYDRLSRSSSFQDMTEVVDETVFTVSDLFENDTEVPKEAYSLCVSAIRRLESLGAGDGGNADLDLERMRLVLWKSRIEEMWGGKYQTMLHIPVPDANWEDREYAKLQALAPGSPVGRYVKDALLTEVSDVWTRHPTESGPMRSLLESPPATSNIRDAITVAKLRTWGLALCAGWSSGPNQMREKAILLQYVIDCAGSLPGEVQAGMNSLDKVYFKEALDNARKDLEALTKQADAAGVNIAGPVEHRVPLDKFNYVNLIGGK